MSKREKLEVRADGTVPIITDDVNVTYSEQEFNTNWLLNKILGTRNKQITKISDDELMKFLMILDQSRLKMPDGLDSLEWLKQRLSKRYHDSQVQPGLSWENISRRYQFILHQIDILLATRTSDSG